MYKRCACCEELYFSTDSKWVCSSECQEQMESKFKAEQLEELEFDLESLIDEYITADLSEAEFKRKWNMRIYDAEFIEDLHPDDFGPIVNELKKEHKINEHL